MLSDLELELIQIRPKWFIYNNNRPGLGNIDVNVWSRVHPRFKNHDGCIVDLGCLGWNKDFNDKESDNWAGYFFNKKRVIGVDPQEYPNPDAEFFKGFISSFSGKANLSSEGIDGQMVRSSDGKYTVLTWNDFKTKFSIDSISILKINIEGAEWDLIKTLNADDFSSIDQIAISFHDFLPSLRHKSELTALCIDKILSNGYKMVDLGIYGWRLFVK